MKGYFWPRSARGRLLMGGYVVFVALCGFVTAAASSPLGAVSQAVGYIAMAPTTILALPVVNGVEGRLYAAAGYSSGAQTVTLTVLFALGGLANAVLITYLRTSDARF